MLTHAQAMGYYEPVCIKARAQANAPFLDGILRAWAVGLHLCRHLPQPRSDRLLQIDKRVVACQGTVFVLSIFWTKCHNIASSDDCQKAHAMQCCLPVRRHESARR